MQIRLVIGEQDSRYLEHFTAYLERSHFDQVEVVSFSKPQAFLDYLSQAAADIILLDEAFGLSHKELPSCGKVALLSEAGNGTMSDGTRRIGKFKKPDLIYKDILDLYAESGSRPVGPSDSGKPGHLILVTSVSGGTGASTFAAALARESALRGQKVLYLNLETTGMSSDFFSGSGDYHFEDVIFALKSQRTDLRLKIESTVRQDACGVRFFAPCTNAMYMLELSDEDILKLLDALNEGCGYDRVVVDMNFRLGGEFLEIMSRMSRIVLVQDGGETSNSKFRRAMEALAVLEQQTGIQAVSRMALLYNRFSSSKSSSELTGHSLPVLGKLPPIKHALVREIIDYMLTRQDVFAVL